MNLIEYNHIHLSFGNQAVLRDISLKLKREECVLLTGRNGAGKSTLLKIMAGLLRPNSGQICYQGAEFSWLQAKPHLRSDVIYLHQHPYLFDATVVDNIAYGLKRLGVNRQQIRDKVSEALNWAQLDHLALRQATTLSGGEQQRVALTRARVLTPKLLLLDEPTASMDRESKQQTQFLLRRLQSEGIAIVISSHEPQSIQKITDRHLALEDGELRTQRNQIGPSAAQNQVKPIDLQS